jgi:hypothetical protein
MVSRFKSFSYVPLLLFIAADGLLHPAEALNLAAANFNLQVAGQGNLIEAPSERYVDTTLLLRAPPLVDH